jgi:hypothetical protein
MRDLDAFLKAIREKSQKFDSTDTPYAAKESVAFSISPAPKSSQQSPVRQHKICGHFNSATCAYGNTCRFSHICSDCGSRDHPASIHLQNNNSSNSTSKVHTEPRNNDFPNSGGGPKMCTHFNSGTCAYGAGCRFRHACGKCGSREHSQSSQKC